MNDNIVICSTGIISPTGTGENGADYFILGSNNKIDLKKHLEDKTGLPERIGRMSGISKLGLIGVSQALNENGMDKKINECSENTSVVIQSSSGCIESDRLFYEGMLKNGASYASPAHFSYTLPNQLIGEICIHYKFKGENLCFYHEDELKFIKEGFFKTVLGKGFCLCANIEYIDDITAKELNLSPISRAIFFILCDNKLAKNMNINIMAKLKINKEEGCSSFKELFNELYVNKREVINLKT
jgi:hypothetical protein